MNRAQSRGEVLARALAGAWRREPPAAQVSADELAEVAPLLLASGSAGLAWRRVRRSELAETPLAEELRQAYRWQALQLAVSERHVAGVFRLSRSAGLEPLLGKGWAAAQLYPDPGLRPCGDVDLYLAPEQEAAAQARLVAADGGMPDLHGAEHELDDRPFAELFRRSQLAPLGEQEVRIFGPEDHLRLLSVHFFKHGAWRPLWLCDIGAALETRPPSFDWDYLLSGDRRRTEWVVGTLGLANQLLGARLDGCPVAEQATRLPRWLIPAVLRQWGEGKNRQAHGECLPWSTIWHEPRQALQVLRSHWSSPLVATVARRAPLNELPRLPIQLADLVARGSERLGRGADRRRGTEDRGRETEEPSLESPVVR